MLKKSGEINAFRYGIPRTRKAFIFKTRVHKKIDLTLGGTGLLSVGIMYSFVAREIGKPNSFSSIVLI
jgi:hypothetical protein